MSERRDSWSDDRMESQSGGGIILRTLRYLIVLVVAGLVVAWALDAGRELSQVADQAARQPVAPAARQPSPAAEPSFSYGDELTIAAGPRGHFVTEAFINGTDIRVLVDTGASIVMLTPDDAEQIGFRPLDDDFSQVFQTPSGVMRGAPVVLQDVRIGHLEVDNVQATIAESPSAISLLGMSFLGRLEGYEVRGDELLLRW